MTLSSSMRISSSGMVAERFRMDVISANIANANSMRTPTQDAYRRRDVELIGGPDGVKIGRIVIDGRPLRQERDPSNPNAVNGIVTYSNVNPIEEMVSMIGASRAYEANIAAFNATKGMMKDAMNIGRA